MKSLANHKIAFYIRVSTEEQAENPEGSIKNQEDRLRTMVKLKNMESNFGNIVDVYIDRAKSGKDTKRPELQRLLQDIKLRKVNLVMASELSRISRSMRDFSEIWELMKTHNCGFYSLRENFDTTTAAGEMVLYTLANLAQFERRQISERVAANMNIRASRGLYNGGSVPLGYKLIEDKPGYLAVDEAHAETVRVCFKSFLREGSLSQAARWLNDNKYEAPKRMQGGGLKQRHGFFTVDSLHHILKNKVYIGVREYQENGEIKEAKANWEPIVERDTFDNVQSILETNKSAKKPFTQSRYPYILTGLTFCVKCGNPLVGKSAHGRHKKIGYYEHGWATKRQSCLTKKIFTCDPHRVNAQVLEGVVLEKVKELLNQPDLSRDLVFETGKYHSRNPNKKQIDRLKALVYGYNSQLEAISERLSQLPKSVSPSFFFAQMEKLEKNKQDALQEIELVERQGGFADRPAELKDFQNFLGHLKTLFDAEALDKETQNRILKRLISRIEVGVESFCLKFIVSETNVKMGIDEVSVLNRGGSNSLTNGAP
ncbi:MAG: hypothetical protein A4S09_17485 [Proteobacteria bacterium SG_bin7]|nr:MAG: hypothetical protein A4S09_17485 [Proteobacteria bacterium SG_bin7]